MKVAIVCISLIVFAYSAHGVNVFGSNWLQIFNRNKCVGKHAEFEQLTVTPSFVSIFGNVPIKIQFPSVLHDAVSVQIRINDKTVQLVDASITGSTEVTCILPFLYKYGRIQLDILVTQTDNTILTFYGFIYTQKHSGGLQFELSGTSIKVSWEKTHFDVGATLDLELFELVGGIFTSRGVIVPNIPNEGYFIGVLDRLALILIQNVINIYIIQLKVNINLGGSGSSQNSTKPQNPLITNWLNQLKGKSERELNQLCYSWYVQDKGAPRDAECCPRTLKQARVDERFEPVDDLKLYNPEADYGFMQKVPSRSGAAQRCVYKNGTLLVGPPSGGNVRSVSPNGENGEVAHIIADILPWYTCCKLSVTKSYCNLYYERRPSDDGKCYRPPHCGHVTGDPHFTTFDGLYYTFLGLGEFWVIKSKDFAMQGRFTQFKDTATTVCTVYVMYQQSHEGEATVQLSLKEKYIEIMIDGQVVAMDPNIKQPKRTIMYNGVSIVIVSPEDIRITFSTGYSFKFTYDPYVINMAALVAEEVKGTFAGLFGVFDDNQENELTYSSGKIIPTNSDSRTIHDFGMSWKITCEESHFTYPFGKGYANYQDDSFVPLFEVPDLDKLSPEDVEACKGSYECLFDLSVTGNREMAIGTQKAVGDFSAIAKSTRVGCDRLSAPRNGYLVVINYSEGSTVRLVCNANFQVQGPNSVKCVRNILGMLSWDGTLGVCVKNCANDNAWLQWLCENGLSAQ